MVKIKTEKLDSLVAKNQTSYIQNDLTLECMVSYPLEKQKLVDEVNSKVGVSADSFLVTFDSLTICFGGTNLTLKSFDAYTNKDLWQNGDIEIPDKISIGKCFIDKNGEDDRMSVNYTPTFIFDKRKSLLKIRTSQSNNEEYWHIADNLIIGVAQGQISSIYVKKLSIK
jgi:hypothetical protein